MAPSNEDLQSKRTCGSSGSHRMVGGLSDIHCHCPPKLAGQLSVLESASSLYAKTHLQSMICFPCAVWAGTSGESGHMHPARPMPLQESCAGNPTKNSMPGSWTKLGKTRHKRYLARLVLTRFWHAFSMLVRCASRHPHRHPPNFTLKLSYLRVIGCDCFIKLDEGALKRSKDGKTAPRGTHGLPLGYKGTRIFCQGY